MSVNKDQKIKVASKEDIPVILKFREALFNESHGEEHDFVKNSNEKLVDFYNQEYEAKTMTHFIAFNDADEPVAVLGALIKNDFPYFTYEPGFYGWIVDAYTRPEYRGKGLASKLLEANIQWLKAKGVKDVKLLAFSKEAIRVYKKFGFKDTNQMSVQL